MVRIAPAVVEQVGISRGRSLTVVRDDLLEGGSKRRVLPSLFEEWPEDEFVFGGPAQGYAQVALAYSATAVGKRSTYFVAERRQLHPLTAEARAAGAKIVQVRAGRLSVVQARARAYCEETGARFLPLGFDIPEFGQRLTAAVEELGLDPPEVWCVAGSGALSRSLQAAWPQAAHYAIQIGFPPKVGAARLLVAPEPFAQPARWRPPFPSCANYDAKAWQFIEALASDGALFWNVAA